MPDTSSRQRAKNILPIAQRTKVLRGIRLVALDVDGVLTDGGMYYGNSGEELKRFQTRDGMGIKLLQADGIITAIVTMENTKIVRRRAKKLGIVEVHQGIRDKLLVLKALASKYQISLREMAYMGDDVNDLKALGEVGFAGAPADCMNPVRRIVHYVCQHKGGEGAVREVADLILAARGAKPLFQ